VRGATVPPTLAARRSILVALCPTMPAVRYAMVLGEQEAMVIEVKPWDVHGVGYIDVTVAYRDRSVETARLGRESVPDDLEAGDEVLVDRAVNMIVGLRKA
jgi:hypothetical protein